MGLKFRLVLLASVILLNGIIPSCAAEPMTFGPWWNGIGLVNDTVLKHERAHTS